MELYCLHIVPVRRGQPGDAELVYVPRIDSSIDVVAHRIQPYLPYDGENSKAQPLLTLTKFIILLGRKRRGPEFSEHYTGALQSIHKLI